MCKDRTQQKGFTLIEIVLVLALAGLIAVASVAYTVPALSTYACAQEVKTAKLALERAQFLSQFSGNGNVSVQINDEGYQMYSEERNHSILRDEINHQAPLPVSATDEIIFQEGSGSLVGNEHEIEIHIGTSSSTCSEVITIHNAGAIL